MVRIAARRASADRDSDALHRVRGDVAAASFFSMLLFLYLRGFQGDCGCFGPGEQLGPKTLARDGTLVALSVWVTWEAFRRSKKAPVATI